LTRGHLSLPRQHGTLRQVAGLRNARMKLTDYLPPSLVKVPLASRDKQSAITELVDLIHQQGLSSSRDALLQAVLEREAQRTTGIGRGFAIPHAKCESVSQLVIAFGRAAAPIDFAAIDGKPVQLIALLASPAGSTSLHIQALAKLSRLVTNGSVFEELLAATSAGELYDVVARSDNGA
jgi:fructose-specific phosphotransferase system IIA component